MVVFGTRPEAIKLAPVIQLLGARAEVVYTGQHYDATLGANVIADLALRPPSRQLGIGGKHRGHQIGLATAQLTDLMLESRPSVVLVQGDTNAGLAGALAANAVGLPLVHIEAGLRSFDRAMPEEHNRVLIDHLADLCAAPTPQNADNLRSEGIGTDRIAQTGNTIIEAVERLLPSEPAQRRQLEKLQLQHGEYVVATIHRPENVDDAEIAAQIFTQLSRCSLPVVVPIHPRTRKRLAASGLTSLLDSGSIRTIDPLPPRAFLSLSAGARLWVTDSGGLQEEATILKRRALVVRRSTERPEALKTFSVLVDHQEVGPRLAAELEAESEDLTLIESPFGDGRASERIVAAIESMLHRA